MDKLAKYAAADKPPNERRNSARRLINGRVWFQWQAAEGNWHDAVGSALDIGEAGVFIESASIPPVASSVKLVVVLPNVWEADTTRCFSGFGHVRHVRQNPRQTSGFGASAVLRKEVPMSTGSTQEKQKHCS
jgi:hypothetical protein